MRPDPRYCLIWPASYSGSCTRERFLRAGCSGAMRYPAEAPFQSSVSLRSMRLPSDAPICTNSCGKQVRDEELSSSDVHTKLLGLPWRDVFTTNWDTLLERARIQVPERAYSVVVNMGEIPLARQPRIVKLHGSLPAQFPLSIH